MIFKLFLGFLLTLSLSPMSFCCDSEAPDIIDIEAPHLKQQFLSIHRKNATINRHHEIKFNQKTFYFSYTNQCWMINDYGAEKCLKSLTKTNVYLLPKAKNSMTSQEFNYLAEFNDTDKVLYVYLAFKNKQNTPNKSVTYLKFIETPRSTKSGTLELLVFKDVKMEDQQKPSGKFSSISKFFRSKNLKDNIDDDPLPISIKNLSIVSSGCESFKINDLDFNL